MFPEVILRENNPYSLGSIFPFPEGDFLLDGPELVFKKSESDRYYTLGNTDDLWNIAHQAYRNSKWWWVIFFANPEIEHPLDLPIGKTILIPDLITFQVNNL